MSKKLISILAILGIPLLLVFGGLIAYGVYHRAFSAKLALPGGAGSRPVTGDVPGLCNGPSTMTILAIGEDYRGGGGDYLYGLADVIRIVRIDFTKPSVSVLSIPRDLWVHIPGLSDRNIDVGKINQAYFYGAPAMGYYKGPAGGAGLLADTLYDNFGLFPDHYVAVSMQATQKLIDAVGGIDVTLSKPVDGNAQLPGAEPENLGFYSAGTHHFDGATALKFARIRYGYSDLDRIDNQSIVLKALFERMTTQDGTVNPADILGGLLEANVLTDFAPSDMLMFSCLAKYIDYSDIKFITLPSDTFSASTVFSPVQKDYVFAYVPDTTKVTDVIRTFQEGIWP